MARGDRAMVNDAADNTLEKLLRGEISVYEVSDKRCKQILIKLVRKIRERKPGQAWGSK